APAPPACFRAAANKEPTIMMTKLCALFFGAALVAACSGGGDSGGSTEKDDTATNSAAATTTCPTGYKWCDEYSECIRTTMRCSSDLKCPRGTHSCGDDCVPNGKACQ